MAHCRVLIALALISSVITMPDTAAQSVPDGYIQVALTYGVPPEALYSVSMTETSMAPRTIAAVMKLRQTENLPAVSRPWPWTINVAGRGYRYASRLEAWQALQVFINSYPPKRIDVGLAQVNLGWNGYHFASTWDAFDPYTNLNVAAAILRECWNRKPGSWLDAAGCYHHPAGGTAATRYKGIVKRHLTRLQSHSRQLSSSQLTPVSQAIEVIAPAPASGFIWTEPRN